MAVRKQLYLTDRQERLLKQRARATGQAEAALVREALEQYLGAPAGREDDPLLQLAPVDMGDASLSERHDDILYGPPRRERPRR